MSTNSIAGKASETRHYAERTGTELQRSARQAGRTLRTAAETLRAIARDGVYVFLGAGDAAASAVREGGRATFTLPRRVFDTVWETPNHLSDGWVRLSRRGQHLAARIRRDPEVRAALRRTGAARRETAEAVESVRSAARAHVRGARKASSRLGRQPSRRYEAMTIDELHEVASQRDIAGRSAMNKRRLIAALRR